MRGICTGYEEDLLKVEEVSDLLCSAQMTIMDRIKGPSKDADIYLSPGFAHSHK